MTVSDNSQSRKFYPSNESTEKAKAILSSATYLDNLVAGERRPSGEHIWAFNVLLFTNDKAKRRYIFGCWGSEITNAEFLNLLDTERIKRKYFEIENFDPYLENKDGFVKDSGRFMIDTGFGL